VWDGRSDWIGSAPAHSQSITYPCTHRRSMGTSRATHCGGSSSVCATPSSRMHTSSAPQVTSPPHAMPRRCHCRLCLCEVLYVCVCVIVCVCVCVCVRVCERSSSHIYPTAAPPSPPLPPFRTPNPRLRTHIMSTTAPRRASGARAWRKKDWHMSSATGRGSDLWKTIATIVACCSESGDAAACTASAWTAAAAAGDDPPRFLLLAPVRFFTPCGMQVSPLRKQRPQGMLPSLPESGWWFSEVGWGVIHSAEGCGAKYNTTD
jgi:hypothetical protein